jgi:flagellar biosynthesis protein
VPERDNPAKQQPGSSNKAPLALPARLDINAPVKQPDRPKTIAVALKKEGDETPVVVASGRGSLAEAILEVAFAAGVKVREDADLAELLVAADVDLPIPPSAFEAVAEIMTYLYRANAAATPAP